MIDFEVVYAHGAHRENLLISKVYAVNDHDFLLVDENGDFRWVPMRFCALKSRWESKLSTFEEKSEDYYHERFGHI